MGHVLLSTFLYPGNVACDLLGLDRGDDRMMVRTLVNMLVWNLVGVILVFELY